jgi:pyridoxal phosphate enzyme (YggS family)
MAWQNVLEKIQLASEKAGRNFQDIEVLPVSKSQSVENIISHLNQKNFPQKLGENYFDELSNKKKEIEKNFSVEWHFLGRLQSRKIIDISRAVHTVHSVSRIKELERISLLELRQIPYVYLQINVSNETSKGGFGFEEGNQLKEKIEELDLGKKLKGVMTLASPLSKAGEKQVRKEFAMLRNFRDQFFSNSGLSMGMSDDFLLAIEEGSTCIRLGSIIFGAR